MRKGIVSLFFLSACMLNAQNARNFISGQAARAEIGQPDFSSGQSGVAGNLLAGASGVAYANGLLWVADSNVLAGEQNNRVLSFPTALIPGLYADLTQITPATSACGLCGYVANNVLGQPDYVSNAPGRSQAATSSGGSMQIPTAVATDGTYLAVADTNNNRVLIWNSIPTTINAAPNIVLGQSNFTAGLSATAQTGLSGPQGVWIQNGALFVADTHNGRVLVWRHMPTQNGQAADLVLGEPDFGTVPSPPVGTYPPTAANLMRSPTSVTSDGTRLYVADFGNNRVLIWNTAFVNGQLSLTNDQNADIAVGQPLLTTSVSNWSSYFCGGDNFEPCAQTLNNPRFALSDGARLFVADTGNDRVLIYNTIPTQNGASADEVLGQVDFGTDQDTSSAIDITSTAIDNTGAVDIMTPTSLAFDGLSLYVTDPYNMRVLVFSPGDTQLPNKSAVNWASEIIRQEGVVTLAVPAGGAIVANDTATITIQGTDYPYTITANDTLDSIAQNLVNVINTSNSGAGDPYSTAIFAGAGTGSVYLSSKATNLPYDAITLAASTSNGADITATTPVAYLSAGNAGTGSAGMLVEIDGTNLSDNTASTSLNGQLPTSLGGVQVFMDGLASPVLSVSPTQIISEIPFSFTNGSDNTGVTVGTEALTDRNSTSIYVRTEHNDGSVTVTNATPMYIAPANPGLFNAPAYSGEVRPWPVINAFHQPGNATTVISVDGSVTAGNTASITIGSATYTYTVVSTDTLLTIAQNLANMINNAPDANVTASLGGAYQRIILTAIQSGGAGTGIAISGTSSAGATVTITAYTASTCCNVVPGSPITATNPAVPGELISVSATGLGPVQDSSGNVLTVATGQPWFGPVLNTAVNAVNATMNGETAETITAGLVQAGYGIYAVQMVVPSDLAANPTTQLYIAQNAFISNTATIPVGAAGTYTPPVPPGAGLSTAQILVNPTNLVLNAGSASPTQSATVTVTNPNSVLLVIGAISITGANAADFTYNTTCQNTVAQSCTITVTYTPSSTAIENASLVISDNVSGSSQSVSLIGVSGAQYEIANKLSGRVLDVVGASTANGTPVQQFDYLGGNNQKWTLVPISGGYYVVMNLNSGKVLDVTGFSTANGTTIQQWDYLGHSNQQWMLQPTSSGFYEIVNVNSGLVLDDTGYSFANGTVIQQWQYLGSDNQQWSLIPTQTYRIVNVNSGKVLDDSSYSLNAGTVIQQWDYLGGANQQWQFIPVDNTYYKITNLLSGKVLDATGGSNAAGTLIQQFDYLGGDNQKWALAPTDVSGTYTIVNKATGRVLDVIGASPDNGTQIQQYDYVGGPNQQWKVIVNQ